MRRALFVLLSLFLAPLAVAQAVTLPQIMADPDWIGHPPESVYWSDAGDAIYYSQRVKGENYNELWRVSVSGGEPQAVADEDIGTDSNTSAVYNSDRSQVAWVVGGKLYAKSLPNGSARRLLHAENEVRVISFLTDGRVAYRLGRQFYAIDLATGESSVLSDIRYQDDPRKRGFDTLRAQQQRTQATVVEDERRAHASTDRVAKRRRSTGSPHTIYLGKSVESAGEWLAPSGTQVLLATRPVKTEGKTDQMPNYVTMSGYHEMQELRTRVGRNPPAGETLHLLDMTTGETRTLGLDDIAGIDKDPLAELRKSALKWHTDQGADKAEVEKALAFEGLRPVLLHLVRFSPDGKYAALRLHSVDNKDRWIVTIELDDPETLTVQHRLTDEAWVNYHHNEFGWLPDSSGLWYLSEQSGYSHLYEKALASRRASQLTSGDFVVASPVLNAAGTEYTFVANREHPSVHDIYRLRRSDKAITNLSDLKGVSSFALGPDGRSIAILQSEFDRHPELFVRLANESTPRQLTDTVEAAYKAIDWVIPEIIEIPSSHVDRPIFSKLYLPADFDPDKQYPAVMFVHGAGYTQNAHAGWPYYFREFMFHTLLTQHGYVVLDMDYRASKGYGRDWRTAIYRRMGEPELEDFLDGVDFLVDNYSVKRDQIGIYGGSYGGFMTFMALFLEPDVFAAGAALRPVADWMHYNHGYTSNILNTPLVDPQAYERSSPINFAEGLTKPLLIAAGMQDDNVFFQDSVLVVQRLMELEKEDFEIALYPLDPHGFVHASAWLDEYRRIFKLMERYVKR